MSSINTASDLAAQFEDKHSYDYVGDLDADVVNTACNNTKTD